MKYPYLYQKLYPALYEVLLADFKTAEKKFVEQGVSKEEIKRSFEEFKTLKPKIKEVEKKDIDLWAQGDFEKFKIFLNSLKETKSKNEIKKLTKAEGATLVAENNDWWVYKITTHEACKQYGSNTKWCITSPSGAEWRQYSASSNFYFIISKHKRDDTFNKIAYQIDNTGGDAYWDEKDNSYDDLDGLGLNIPIFTVYIPSIDTKIISTETFTEDGFGVHFDVEVNGLRYLIILQSISENEIEMEFGRRTGADLDQSAEMLQDFNNSQYIHDFEQSLKGKAEVLCREIAEEEGTNKGFIPKWSQT